MQTATGTPPAIENTPVTSHAADDARLVEMAQADARAFAPLYGRYAEPVYRYCYRKLGHPEIAADATAQVFVQALAALPRYRSPGNSFRAWLFTTAHVPTADPLPEEALLRLDAGVTVRTLLATLPDEQRQILELRLAGLTGGEIATVLGRSPGAVRVAQVRAIARLREMWAAGDAARAGEDTR